MREEVTTALAAYYTLDGENEPVPPAGTAPLPRFFSS